MGEVKNIKEKISGPKLIAFIGMLYTLELGIDYFYAGYNYLLSIMLLIICLIIVFLTFVALEFINLGPVKIAFQWWIIFIFGIVLTLLAYFFGERYFPAVLLLLAALIEIIMKKKPYKASKMVLLVGIGFSIYECVILFLTPLGPSRDINVINGIFGSVLLILLLVVFRFNDFKYLNYSWWLVLLIGFIILTWVSPYAFAIDFGMVGNKAPVVGFGGTIILIAFVLIVMGL